MHDIKLWTVRQSGKSRALIAQSRRGLYTSVLSLVQQEGAMCLADGKQDVVL